MRIVLVSPFPLARDRVFGGVAGASKYLADELVRRPGLSVSVIVPQGAPGPAPVVEDWDGLRVYRLPRTGAWRRLPGTAYDLAAGKRQVRRLLDRLAPDVVHFQGVSFLAAGCARRSVLTIHGIAEKDALFDARRSRAARWVKRGLLRATEQYGRRAAPNVILISEAVEELLPDNARRRVWHIANPVADSFFEVERRPRPGRVFCCSRLAPLKNVVGMIGAFASVAQRFPDAQLRVAGEGDEAYAAACRAEAARLGVADRVLFLGGLTVEGVRAELAEAACFALPSFQENAPLSLAEAMAAGVPAVAAHVGGVPEMVIHRETGLLVDPTQPAAIADSLSELLEDPLHAETLGRRARALALGRHRASEVALQTEQVYREIREGR